MTSFYVPGSSPLLTFVPLLFYLEQIIHIYTLPICIFRTSVLTSDHFHRTLDRLVLIINCERNALFIFSTQHQANEVWKIMQTQIMGALFIFLLPFILGFPNTEPSEVSQFSYAYKLTERLLKLEQDNENLKDRISQLEANKTARVSVMARLLGNQNLGSNSRVRYDGEMWNIGKAYNFDDGEFVTPVSGIYLVAVTSCLSSGGQWMDLDIIKDGAIVGRVFSGDHSYHSCGSETISIHLEQGNKVWVNRVAGTATVLNQDHGWNTFTAVLIVAD